MEYVPPIGKTGTAAYVDGDPLNDIEGDPVSSKAWEHPMREILAVIEAAGIAPSDADLTQLVQAIDARADVRADARVGTLRPFANSGEVDNGTEAGKVVTPASLGTATKLLASNGYLRLPGGLLINWGRFSVIAVGGYTSFTFPMAFTSQLYSVVVTADTTSSGLPIGVTVQGSGSSHTSIFVRNSGAAAVGGYIIAVGR